MMTTAHARHAKRWRENGYPSPNRWHVHKAIGCWVADPPVGTHRESWGLMFATQRLAIDYATWTYLHRTVRPTFDSDRVIIRVSDITQPMPPTPKDAGSFLESLWAQAQATQKGMA